MVSRCCHSHTTRPLAATPPLLKQVTVPARDSQSAPCQQQAEPARQLANLAKVPVLMLTSEASYHTVYDYCTAAHLQQAGVDVTYVPLQEAGIHGNGHFIFMERNNLEVAEKVVKPWVDGLDEA